MSSITADGDAVDVEHQIRPAFMATLKRHLLGQGEVVVLRVLPVDQVHILVRPPGGKQHLHRVAQQVVGAQVGLVERDAGHIGGGFQLLQGGGDMRLGVAALAQVGPQQIRLDGSVVLALVPVAEVAIAQPAVLPPGG